MGQEKFYYDPSRAAAQTVAAVADKLRRAKEGFDKQQAEANRKKPPLKTPTSIEEYRALSAEDIRALMLKPQCKAAIEELFRKENLRRNRAALKQQIADEEAADAMSQDFNTRIGGRDGQ